jgi:hypothetical protein
VWFFVDSEGSKKLALSREEWGCIGWFLLVVLGTAAVTLLLVAGVLVLVLYPNVH